VSKHDPDVLLDCTVCGCEFDLEGEGGYRGSIGMKSVQFCQTCLSGIREIAEGLWLCRNCESVTMETGDDGITG